MSNMRYAQPFQEMIEWFDQILGVQPVPRCEEGIECDMQDGTLNIRFTSGPKKPSEEAISHVMNYVTGRGYTITRPERDDDDVLLEVSLSIDDIHQGINRFIERRKEEQEEFRKIRRDLDKEKKRARESVGDDTTRVQTRIRRQGYRLRAENLREEYIQTREREFNDPQIVNHIEEMRVRYPEWYNAIRQLNEDVLETDRSWWEGNRKETLIEQWDCKVIMWALDDMHRREKA